MPFYHSPLGEPGALIFDATCLKHLCDPDSAAVIRRNSRTAHLRLYPTTANVLEALGHPNREIRRRLIQSLAEWQQGRPLLPWPTELLRLAGEGLLRGDNAFTIGSTELDVLVFRADALDADHKKAVEFLARREAGFRQAHSEALRREFQETLKREGLNPLRFATAAEYLDAEANTPEVIAARALMIWSAVDLPGDPPALEDLMRSEPWKIFLEGLGVATYYRSIRAKQQGNPAGFVDLSQLVYLTAHTRCRILVTDDASLRETATALLRGRYQNVRVTSGAEFLAS